MLTERKKPLLFGYVRVHITAQPTPVSIFLTQAGFKPQWLKGSQPFQTIRSAHVQASCHSHESLLLASLTYSGS